MTVSKNLSKHIAAFDYIDKTLIILSATSGGISIISFTSVIGIPAGIASASFTLTFLFNYRENKIVMLAKCKLGSIETLMSETLIHLDISHEEFKTIVNEKEKYQQMKENIRNTKIKTELSENSRDIRKNSGNTKIF